MSTKSIPVSLLISIFEHDQSFRAHLNKSANVRGRRGLAASWATWSLATSPVGWCLVQSQPFCDVEMPRINGRLVRRSHTCPLAGFAPNTMAGMVCLEGRKWEVGEARTLETAGGGDGAICTFQAAGERISSAWMETPYRLNGSHDSCVDMVST